MLWPATRTRPSAAARGKTLGRLRGGRGGGWSAHAQPKSRNRRGERWSGLGSKYAVRLTTGPGPPAGRLHAVLQYRGEDGAAFLHDPGSTHGVFINKQKIPTGRHCPLRCGPRDTAFGAYVRECSLGNGWDHSLARPGTMRRGRRLSAPARWGRCPCCGAKERAKKPLPPRRDCRVGDMVRLGQSSRLYVFTGPGELMPEEGPSREQKHQMAALKVWRVTGGVGLTGGGEGKMPPWIGRRWCWPSQPRAPDVLPSIRQTGDLSFLQQSRAGHGCSEGERCPDRQDPNGFCAGRGRVLGHGGGRRRR